MNSPGYPYVQTVECDVGSLQPRHSQIIQQYSSSTDEGCDTDHGEMDDVLVSSLPPSIQRLNSYASSSSSSGVVTNFHSKSLSQNLSCESSRSNFSTFESLDLNLSDCSDLAASLPSCATSTTQATTDSRNENGKPWWIDVECHSNDCSCCSCSCCCCSCLVECKRKTIACSMKT